MSTSLSWTPQLSPKQRGSSKNMTHVDLWFLQCNWSSYNRIEPPIPNKDPIKNVQGAIILIRLGLILVILFVGG